MGFDFSLTYDYLIYYDLNAVRYTDIVAMLICLKGLYISIIIDHS